MRNFLGFALFLATTVRGDRCMDNADAMPGGYACADWGGYDCCDDALLTGYGTSSAEMKEQCPSTCNTESCPIHYCQAPPGPLECSGTEPAAVDYNTAAMDIFAVDCAGLVNMGYCANLMTVSDPAWAEGKPGSAMVINALSHLVCGETCAAHNNYQKDEAACATSTDFDSIPGVLCYASYLPCYQSFNNNAFAGMLTNMPCEYPESYDNGILLPGPNSEHVAAYIQAYPGVENPITGTADIQLADDGFTQMLNVALVNLEPNSSIKIHIHTGTTCRDADKVGGHFWQPADAEDVWNGEEFTLATNEQGEAYYIFDNAISFDNGYSIGENNGHAVVVYDSTGARVGCGVLSLNLGTCSSSLQFRAYCGETCLGNGTGDAEHNDEYNCLSLNAWNFVAGDGVQGNTEGTSKDEQELFSEYRELNCAEDEFCKSDCRIITPPDGTEIQETGTGVKFIAIYLTDEDIHPTVIRMIGDGIFVHCFDSQDKGSGNVLGQCTPRKEYCNCETGFVDYAPGNPSVSDQVKEALQCKCVKCANDGDCPEGQQCHHHEGRSLLFGQSAEGHCA